MATPSLHVQVFSSAHLSCQLLLVKCSYLAIWFLKTISQFPHAPLTIAHLRTLSNVQQPSPLEIPVRLNGFSFLRFIEDPLPKFPILSLAGGLENSGAALPGPKLPQPEDAEGPAGPAAVLRGDGCVAFCLLCSGERSQVSKQQFATARDCGDPLMTCLKIV